MFTSARPAYSEGGDLTQAEIKETLTGHTLVGHDWAEFYLADGTIRGRARAYGLTFNSTASWSVSENKVCYRRDRWCGERLDGEHLNVL